MVAVTIYYETRNPLLYHHAAVAADASQCSQAGVEILEKGGTAVDAAAASVLCLGVVNLHSTGEEPVTTCSPFPYILHLSCSKRPIGNLM